MRIKKRLQLHIALSMTMAVVVCLLLLLSLHRINAANDSAKVAGEIMTGFLERVTFRNDYIRNNTARAKAQWFAKHDQIGELLKSASKNFPDAQDRRTIEGLIEDHKSFGRIFSAIVAFREKGDSGFDSADLLREAEERLLSQLNMRVYEAVIHGRELVESSGKARGSALRFAGGGVILVLLILIAAAIANSWTLGKAVKDRVGSLHEGASVIGEGNLDHRIDLRGDDEFAELSDAFNEMTARLQGSYRDLETEIAERKRAEEALREARDGLEIRVEERTKELNAANETAGAERRRLYDVLETLPVYVVLLTADYHVPFANRFFRERMGESGGKRCYEYLFNRTEPCEICETYTVQKTNRPHHWYWTGPDGRDYDIYDFPFVDSDGATMILEMGMDITDRKRAEAALKEANEMLERRVAERTAELRIANESLQSSRAAALNLMDDAVSARKRAEEKSEELGREIAERNRAEEALQKAHGQLQEHAGRLRETNRELEGFAYTISHDLRAPLRAINGFAHMLAVDCGPSLGEEGKRQLTVIETNAVKMGHLIDDLLAFSRAGRTAMNVAGIDMNRLVAEVVETLKGSDVGAKADILVAALPPAQGDPAMIRQVLANLLENAVKFSRNRPEPKVEVGSFERDGEEIYFVRDNGVGFDMKYHDKLFGVFQRLVTEKEFEGTGVGLAIVQRFVTRHGGRVWAESRPGEGASFFFTLQKRQLM